LRFVRIAALFLGSYIAIALALDAAIGTFQPRTPHTAVLRTFDVAGHSRDTVLDLLEADGQLWVESERWFRGWYHRIQERPRVELIRNGQAEWFDAVPVDSPEAVERIARSMGKGAGAEYWASRAMFLWAPIKPVRLDPAS